MKHIKHYPTKTIRLYPYGVHWSHATKTGGAVLLDEVSWRNINGIWIGTPGRRIWLLFRRAG
jgi:hypothetical protein